MTNGVPASLRKRNPTHGLPPGTVLYVGQERRHTPSMQWIAYTDRAVTEIDPATLETAAAKSLPGQIGWLNIDGLSDTALLEEVGRHFDIHALTLEDIANTTQRPKYDLFDQYAFLTFKMLRVDPTNPKGIIAEHVGLVLKNDLAITFQEAPGDVFGFVRERIRSGRGRIRSMKADYLAYSLLDAVIDGYFSVLEAQGDQIAELDEALLEGHPSANFLRDIHRLKRQIIYVRRAAWPLRELIGSIQKTRTELFDDSTDMYFRDLYDHCIQVLDSIETDRDLLASLTELYVSITGNRMNEIMKVLTIIATLFIPLTFVAGVYGMNFRHMPELHQTWGYPAVLVLMLCMTVGMLLFFRRKKWL